MAFDDELERFKREVNLTEYAASAGYQLVERVRPSGGPSRGGTASSIAMRHPGTDDKIIIRRDRDDHWTYFSVRDERDNGTIVDFIQKRRSLTIGGVRKELREWLRVDRPRLPTTAYRPVVQAQCRDLKRAASEYANAQLDLLPHYLMSRGLRPWTLVDARFKGCFRVDRRGTLLFPHRHPEDPGSVGGFEKKADGFTGFSTGGTKTLWLSATRPDDRRLVIVEGTIDALSFHQLNPDVRTRYASTGGAVGVEQLRFIERAFAALPEGCTLVDATDSDTGGERLRKQLDQVRGGRVMQRFAPPVGKDWNDTLKHEEQQYIRTLGVRRERRLER
jgi:hypothetical protein